jgi:hypothetical protein
VTAGATRGGGGMGRASGEGKGATAGLACSGIDFAETQPFARLTSNQVFRTRVAVGGLPLPSVRPWSAKAAATDSQDGLLSSSTRRNSSARWYIQ